MYTKLISLILAFGLTSSLLVSCSDAQNTDQTSSDTVTQDQSDVGTPPPDASGYTRRPMNGSGAYMNGSGSGRGGRGPRGGSGSMMRNLSPEDQAIFTQIRAARQSGDTATADKLMQELRQKNPNLKFGSGARMTASGTAN